MTCNCKCHPAVASDCWCPNCMDDHIDFAKVIAQIESCEYCGDGIPRNGMEKHIVWCKPMVEGES